VPSSFCGSLINIFSFLSFIMSFQQLGLISPILQALQEKGYVTPTPIQEKSIPVVLKGKDLFGCAQTGTGKTAAFTIPILQLLQGANDHRTGSRKAVRALIMTPTRELAIQIGESIGHYGRFLHLSHQVIFGGVSQQAQVEGLQRGVDILVATPGRLLDLMQQRILSLDQIQIFVLDEADRMLDMGFIHDVRKVIAKLPARRQTLFFSATVPEEIQKLAGVLLKDPIKVEVAPVSSTVDTIQQMVYHVPQKEKLNLLIHFLQDATIKNLLVFTKMKHAANKLAQKLMAAGIPADAIHGNKSQTARQRALEHFKLGKIRVLVATDIAARGIDINELSHVLNYDLPDVPETYVHRIGRTGRAGASGTAISFCDPEERSLLRDIERLIRKQIPAQQANVPQATVHSTPNRPIPLEKVNRPSSGGQRRGMHFKRRTSQA
jgi:ATP-dependent RNA helicase RhlE